MVERFDMKKYVFSDIRTKEVVSVKQVKAREKEIELLTRELFLYKVLLKDLLIHLPTHHERNLILNIAYGMIENQEIFDRFQRRRILSINTIVKYTKLSRAFVETWQDYIITYAIILSNPNYKGLQDYLKVELAEEGEQKKYALGNTYKGIVLASKKSSFIIMTSDGAFVKVKREKDIHVGGEVEAPEKIGFKHIKYKVAIALVLLIFIGIGVYTQYKKCVSTVIIETSSTIKIEVNKYNNVVYMHSETEKGKKLISKVDGNNEDIDQVIKDSIIYASKNDMIPQDGVVITITGKALEYGSLEKTGKYIVKNNIKVLVNNAGKKHRLYESTVSKEGSVN